MAYSTVEEFVEAKVQPRHRDVVAAIRALMRECAPDAREELTYGILGWKRKRMLAVISPTKKDITFAFSRGAEFEDTYGLLRGVGRVSKHVKIKDLQDLNADALRYYVQQALALDAR
jgi:hypothetical protein